MTTALLESPEVLAGLRRRRDAGENMAALAAEVGVTWQRLWGLLKGPATAGTRSAASEPVVEAHGSGPLVERYRPLTFLAMWGQKDAVRLLKHFAKEPYPTAFLFGGETGTGKTTAALALARQLGCDVEQGEWGGVWEIASGEQSADAVRETGRRMCLKVPQGSGWKVVVVNEADRMSRPAEVIWLDLLEHLPRKSVVVFTTNAPFALPARFRDRCVRVAFESEPILLRSAAYRFAARVWQAETGREPIRDRIERIVDGAIEDDSLSFRRVLQGLSEALLLEGDD